MGGSADSVFWQKYLQPLLTDPTRPCAVLHREIPWQRQALEAMEQAYRAVVNEVPGYEFRARAALSEMIWQLVTHAPSARPIPKKALRNADRIKRMLQYIQDHYAEDVSVDQIAASASISASECLRCFHDMIGTTPNQYLQDRRAQRAAELFVRHRSERDRDRRAVRLSGRQLFLRGRSGRSTVADRQSIAERQGERERCSGKSPRVGLLTVGRRPGKTMPEGHWHIAAGTNKKYRCHFLTAVFL